MARKYIQSEGTNMNGLNSNSWVRAMSVVSLIALGVMVFICSDSYKKHHRTQRQIYWLDEEAAADFQTTQKMLRIMGDLSRVDQKVLDATTNLVMETLSIVIARNLKTEERLLARIEALEAATNRPALGRYPGTNFLRQPSLQPTRENIPVAVYDKIRAHGSEIFDGNFEMQEIFIKQQVEAWKRLNPSPSIAPPTAAKRR